MSREEVGYVFVDAGVVMIGDPCYTLPSDGSERNEIAKDWMSFCNAIEKENPRGVMKPFRDGISIVVSTGYGDGCYPVFVTRNSEGRIASVTVEFIDEDD